MQDSLKTFTVIKLVSKQIFEPKFKLSSLKFDALLKMKRSQTGLVTSSFWTQSSSSRSSPGWLQTAWWRAVTAVTTRLYSALTLIKWWICFTQYSTFTTLTYEVNKKICCRDGLTPGPSSRPSRWAPSTGGRSTWRGGQRSSRTRKGFQERWVSGTYSDISTRMKLELTDFH